MSRNINSNNKKPYCKVCQDAGKSESEYTSHWVKDLTGKTTCPTLLKTECRFCYKLGHTSKFCKELNKKPVVKFTPQTKIIASKMQEKKTNLVFAILNEDIEDEQEEVAITQIIQKNDWASIAAKPKMEPIKQSAFIMLSRNNRLKPAQKPEPKPAPKPEPEPVKKTIPIQMKRWADLSDDEEEDYEDNYEEEDESW
jgi:hypothetical protein